MKNTTKNITKNITKKTTDKIQKGDYGYLFRGRLKELLITLVLMLMVGIIFYTGYLKYHNTKNIFTVFAIVSVIPMARFLVTYIVMVPYKILDKEIYHDISKVESVILVYDALLSSKEKITHLKIVAIRDNSAFVFLPEKYDVHKTEKYLKTVLSTEAKVSTVRCFHKYEEFKRMTVNLSKNESGKYDQKIKEVLLTYSM